MRPARLAAALALAASAATAQPAADPDWPCVQRKVPHLSVGQMWAGPVPEDPGAWREDAAAARLAPVLAARRTPLPEAEDLIAAVEGGDGLDRRERLTRVFLGAFALIDRERARIVEGIGRFARRQRALSERIDALQAEIDARAAETAEDDVDALDRLEEMRDELAWDVRVFEERQRALTYACESPVILERRAFALARAIAAEMEGG